MLERGTAGVVATDGTALLPRGRVGAPASGKPAGQGHPTDSSQKLEGPRLLTHFFSHCSGNTSPGTTVPPVSG